MKKANQKDTKMVMTRVMTKDIMMGMTKLSNQLLKKNMVGVKVHILLHALIVEVMVSSMVFQRMKYALPAICQE